MGNGDCSMKEKAEIIMKKQQANATMGEEYEIH